MSSFYPLDKHMEKVLKKLCELTDNGNEEMVNIPTSYYDKAELELLSKHEYINLMDVSTYGQWGYMVTMNYPGLHYDDLKKEYNRKKRKETRRYWITTGISLLALLIAAISLYISLCQGGE